MAVLRRCCLVSAQTTALSPAPPRQTLFDGQGGRRGLVVYVAINRIIDIAKDTTEGFGDPTAVVFRHHRLIEANGPASRRSNSHIVKAGHRMKHVQLSGTEDPKAKATLYGDALNRGALNISAGLICLQNNVAVGTLAHFDMAEGSFDLGMRSKAKLTL